jgi:2-C-methyl-D-erythritol 4-phosphate cytidylyltransferase
MENEIKLGVIICAAGSSLRMAGTDKLALNLRGKTVLERAVEVFLSCGQTRQIIIASSGDNFGTYSVQFGTKKVQKEYQKITVCMGGETRQQSVAAALKKLDGEINFVAVHDGTRPFVSKELIEKTLDAAVKTGAALPGLFAKETTHIVRDGAVVSTPDRSGLFAAQTPQIFKKELLLRAYAAAERDGARATDDCMLAENIGFKVKLVDCGYENLKLTTPDDFYTAKAILDLRADREVKQKGQGER